ncbi:hypothetical protein I6I99_15495 [Sphingobacterium multivorum]|nr:hypothetical protein [Sphingobacterium multivorum]QQT28764.1 hypothetical protein I6I99_15495 [Sphingobacterium multivorum]
MSHIPLNNEHQLLQQLKDENNSTFEHIYNNYKQQLAVNFLKLLKDVDLATDALQELWAWNSCTAIAPNQAAYSCIIQGKNRHGKRKTRLHHKLLPSFDVSKRKACL